MDLLFSFALGKVEKGSSPLRERRSWAIAMAFAFAMFLHHNRLALWRSRRRLPVRPTQGLFFIYYFPRSAFPAEGDQEPRVSQAFLTAWVCFPRFQWGFFCVSTCYNFGEVEMRQHLPTLSKVPAAATRLAHPGGLHLLVFPESSSYSCCCLWVSSGFR